MTNPINLTWHEENTDGAPHQMRAFVGTGDGWRIVVTSFEIESQGFPPGSRGYDGMACHLTGLVVRLTRDQARKGFAAAARAVDQ
jgi:hypothetical protein